MTGMSAQRSRMKDRGLFRADYTPIAVFDPAAVRDEST